MDDQNQVPGQGGQTPPAGGPAPTWPASQPGGQPPAPEPGPTAPTGPAVPPVEEPVVPTPTGDTIPTPEAGDPNQGGQTGTGM